MRKLGLFIAVMVVMLCIAVGACADGLDLDGETFIPDETFRAYLLQFDTDGDHSLNDEEIDAVTCIDVTNLGVKTLGGLYNFTELEELYCSGNQLTALFTGDNRNLKVVSCEDNNLTSLSVTGNYNLEKLNCSGNELTSLDVSSAYPYLKSLECEDNKISELDISECHDLVKVIIKNKQKEYDTYYSWDGGESGYLSVDKTVSLITGVDKGIVLNDTNFPDETFRAYIERYCDNGDAILTPEEVDSVTSIYVNYEDIKSFKGIEFFTSLKELRCMDIDITSLDLRSNTNLEELNCYGCPIESLDLGQCTKLRLLNCSRTNISSLDVSKNTLLEKLTCWYLPITSIDLSQNANLQELDCLHNNLRELDLSHNPELTQLDCRENQLTKLDLSNNTKLKTVVCNDNQLTALDISKCADLWGVYCYNNQLTELNTENNGTIFSIWCNGNQLTTLDVSKNPKLAYFNCSENKITVLDISKCPALIKLIADETRFEDDKTYGWSRYIPEEYFAVDKNVRLIPVAVESVSLNYTKLDMTAGENKQLTETISPFYAGNQNIRWNSDHPEIAIVDSNGKITAVTPGRATITVTTEDSGKTAACVVTVSPNAEGSVPVLGVTLNKTEMTLSEGAMETLVATVTPAYATNGKFIWSSNNNSVATVDAGGKVTAVAAGKATITAMSEDGTKTASCTVIVDSGDKVEAFVTRCYSIILGRKPDAAGFADWTTALRNKTKTASEIIYGFMGSNEFKNKNYSCSDIVEILYKAMLGRGSDDKGKEYWVTKLEDGQPLAAAINGFCASNEFQRICREYGITPGSVKVESANETGNGNNGADNPRILTSARRTIKKEKAESFIRRCYARILGREVDQDGLTNWTEILTSGQMTPEQVANSFFSSEEFENRNLDGEELVKILYRVYIGREADQEDLNTWVEKLNNGTKLQELVKTFSKTKEFKAIISSMID